MINESLSKSAKAILPYNQTAIRTNDHILTIAKILRWSCMQHEESREKVTKGSSSGIFSYGISRGQLTLATNLSANVLVTLNAWRAGGGLGPCRKAPWNLMHTRFPSGKKNFSRRRRRCRWRQQLVIKNINAKEFNAKSLTSFPRQQQTTQEKLMDLEMDLNVMLRFIATLYPICCWKGVFFWKFQNVCERSLSFGVLWHPFRRLYHHCTYFKMNQRLKWTY